MEAGDAEEDGFGLWVVAGPVTIGDHRTVTTEHLHGGGHLQERTDQQLLVWGHHL